MVVDFQGIHVISFQVQVDMKLYEIKCVNVCDMLCFIRMIFILRLNIMQCEKVYIYIIYEDCPIKSSPIISLIFPGRKCRPIVMCSPSNQLK